MINLSIEIIGLVSEPSRLATGEETRMPPAQLALRRDRQPKHVRDDAIVCAFQAELP